MIRDPAAAVNAALLSPSVENLDTSVSVARAAALDAEYAAGGLRLSGLTPGPANPARDDHRPADVDAGAYAAAAGPRSVTCACRVGPDRGAWSREVAITSPRTGARLAIHVAAAELAVPGVVARVQASPGRAEFTIPELAALADRHRLAAEAAARVNRRFNAKMARRAGQPRTSRGRFRARWH